MYIASPSGSLIVCDRLTTPTTLLAYLSTVIVVFLPGMLL